MAKAKKENIVKEGKLKALQAAMGQIEKNHGKGAIMMLGERPQIEIDVIPTGIPSIDAVLGIGGLPKGRIIEIYGGESSGKTTLTMHAMAECQKQGGIAAIIDAEHAFDPVYARKLGINIDELVVAQPDSGEQALDIAENLVRSGAVDIIIIDSVAALVPKAELEGEMGDSTMALQARLMSQALRKLTSAVSKSNVALVFINQLRMKIGIVFGNPEVTTGGNALKFYASVRIELRKRSGTLKKSDEVLGDTVKIKIVKNKLAAPFRVAEVDVVYGEGFSARNDIFSTAVEAGIIDKMGSWFSYKSDRLGQGKDKAMDALCANEAMFEEVRVQVLSHLGVGAAIEDVAVEPKVEVKE